MSRVLLDENFPAGAAHSLEAAGHEVAMVATLSPGLDDRAVLALARAEALANDRGVCGGYAHGPPSEQFWVAGSGTPG